MKLTEKQLKRIIKESVLNAIASEGLEDGDNTKESFSCAPRIAEVLEKFLYTNSRKASHYRQILSQDESLPEEISDSFTEVIDNIEASMNAAKTTLIQIIKSGLLSDYEKNEAIKVLESSK